MDKINAAREKFSVLDRVPIGVCVLQSDLVVLFWNECLEEWTKIPRKEILGTCITQVYPHLNYPQYANRLKQIFLGGPPTIFSSQLHKHIIPSPLPNGKWRIQHTTVTAEPGVDGVGFNALFSIQDVTDLTYRVQDYRAMRDRALAEVKERQSVEAMLRHHVEMLDLANDSIIIRDLNDTISYWNQGAERLYGWTKAEARGQYVQTLLQTIFPQPLEEIKAACLQQGYWEGELIHTKRSGVQIVVASRWTLQRDGNSSPIAFLEINNDITHRVQAEAEIRRALEKEKELVELKYRFITTTSHEFRTPLSVISSSAAFVEKYNHKIDSAKQLKHFQRIQSSVKYMTQLLEDVLLINQAEVGKLEFNRAPLDLLEFCRDLVEQMQIGINSERTITLNAACDKSLSTHVNMDEKLLRIILSNLVSNAIKYSPSGSTVHFDIAWMDDSVLFQVSDSGIGIPPSEVQHLFELFHRSTNVGNIPGTGLGLAIVKRCVDIHGGEIDVKSKVGVGTTFTVTLPCK